MLSIFLVGVLHAKVINAKAEPDGSCVVFPKSRCVLGGSVAVFGQSFFEKIPCYATCLWQSVHSFVYADVDVSIVH